MLWFCYVEHFLSNRLNIFLRHAHLITRLLPYVIGKAYMLSLACSSTQKHPHQQLILYISVCLFTEVFVKRRSSSGAGKTIDVLHFQFYFCSFLDPWLKTFTCSWISDYLLLFFILSSDSYFLKAMWSIASHTQTFCTLYSNDTMLLMHFV